MMIIIIIITVIISSIIIIKEGAGRGAGPRGLSERDEWGQH